MLLQEVQQSYTRTDNDENMLLNNEYRSHPALDDFQNESAAKNMKVLSFSDGFYQHGDTKVYEELGRGQRTKKMTKKGLEYQLSLMKEKRQNMYSRFFRKWGVVEDFPYSSRNMIAANKKCPSLICTSF